MSNHTITALRVRNIGGYYVQEQLPNGDWAIINYNGKTVKRKTLSGILAWIDKMYLLTNHSARPEHVTVTITLDTAHL